MNKANDSYRKYWEVLTLFEDHVAGGFRRDRQVPDFSEAAGFNSAAGAAGAAGGESCEALNTRIRACTLCGLSANRLQAVPGEGSLSPLVLVVGEGPGADEDRTGRPFVGAAGQYLDKWLSAIGLSRDSNCYITNLVKCRPPQNRDPAPEEISACLPYLKRQLELLAPRAILSLGRFSSQVFTGEKRGITGLRGGSYYYGKIPVVPTFHPSAVLRDNSLRQSVWDDLKRLKDILEHVGVL
ncbi:MAG: uracil-DNA glycosylase [Methanobacteriota archaeon]|nr:MAG: uracil-DNA glycosylase [Euryarchaeota archaeon]